VVNSVSDHLVTCKIIGMMYESLKQTLRCLKIIMEKEGRASPRRRGHFLRPPQTRARYGYDSRGLTRHGVAGLDLDPSVFVITDLLL
jgi:hypothetical protein